LQALPGLTTQKERLALAKNRYGWNKRLKELARKMKQEEKLRRRQNKSQTVAADYLQENGGKSPTESGDS
jgi:hypothetical protein